MEGFMEDERRKRKENSFSFVVVQFELIFGHPCLFVFSSVHALSSLVS